VWCVAVLTLLLLWRCRAREGRFGPLQPPQCVFHRHHRSLARSFEQALGLGLACGVLVPHVYRAYMKKTPELGSKAE
jgi:hypothetical protein